MIFGEIDALTKEDFNISHSFKGRWNAGKKVIEDLNPKVSTMIRINTHTEPINENTSYSHKFEKVEITQRAFSDCRTM